MPPAATQDLTDKLKQVEDDLAGLKTDRQEAHQRFTKAREAFAAQPGYDTKGEHYRRAEAASAAVATVDEKLAGAKSAQVAILRDLGGQSKAASDPDTIDVRQPGGWLSRQLRVKALGVDALGSTADTDDPFFDRLSEQSALMASSPTFIDIQTSSVKIPRLSGRLAPAAPVPELQPIPETDPLLDTAEVEPPKFASLASLSVEAYSDARPVVLGAHELELTRSVASGFDLSAFHGAVGSPQVGIANTTGIATVALDPLVNVTNLDPFARALGALRASATRATAIYLHPSTWEGLSKLKKATDSNEPLVSGERAATDGPAESLFGVAVFQSEVVEQGQAFVADASALVVVRRSNVEVAIDPYFNFSTGAVGVRVIARLALFLPQPAAVCHVTGLTFA